MTGKLLKTVHDDNDGSRPEEMVECMNDPLTLTASQPVLGYFMP